MKKLILSVSGISPEVILGNRAYTPTPEDVAQEIVEEKLIKMIMMMEALKYKQKLEGQLSNIHISEFTNKYEQ